MVERGGCGGEIDELPQASECHNLCRRQLPQSGDRSMEWAVRRVEAAALHANPGLVRFRSVGRTSSQGHQSQAEAGDPTFQSGLFADLSVSFRFLNAV